MTTIWWVRHGPTHAKSFVGWSDIPADLSDCAALERLSDYLPAQAPVISSDLIRSVATADAIQGARERLPHDADLREFNFGDWELKHWTDVAASHPDLSRQYWEQPGDVAAPNGESWHQAARRVDTAVARLVAQTGAPDIIVVAHFGVILTQVAKANRLAPYDALAQKIDNLSVTRISPGKAYPINHTP